MIIPPPIQGSLQLLNISKRCLSAPVTLASKRWPGRGGGVREVGREAVLAILIPMSESGLLNIY
jgi:hypothetical protein